MSPMTTGRIAFTVASIALLVAAGSCRKPEAVQCAGGIFCPSGYQCAKHTNQCIKGTCGNGNVDAGEICDDGGNLNGDVILGETPCSADCKSDESCGNGIRDAGPEEVCDCGVNPLTGVYGCDPVNATGCVMEGPSRCMSTGLCGNGTPDGSEQCDQGKNDQPAWGPTCNIDCTNSRCGDGKINPAALEVCDGGSDTATNGQGTDCNDNCTASRCGDGRINPRDTRAPIPYRAELDRHGLGEQCDDGTTTGNDWNLACLPSCLNNVCGDGHPNSSSKNHQECDLGPASANKNLDCPWNFTDQGCPNLCSECQWVAGRHHYCGDGTPDTTISPEKCDQGSRNVANVNDSSNCPYGGDTCDLCGTDCTSQRSFTPPVCGDLVRNSGKLSNGTKLVEECDSLASLVCGTCSPAGDPATQCKHLDPAGAVGWVTVNKIEGLAGVVVQVTDGVNRVTKTFEYSETANNRSTLPNGHLAIKIDVSSITKTAENTDTAIGDEIDRIQADVQSGTQANRVKLTNQDAGRAGNTDIVVTNNDGGAISVENLIGGTGCRNGDPCDVNTDCVNSTCNTTTHKCN